MFPGFLVISNHGRHPIELLDVYYLYHISVRPIYRSNRLIGIGRLIGWANQTNPNIGSDRPIIILLYRLIGFTYYSYFFRHETA